MPQSQFLVSTLSAALLLSAHLQAQSLESGAVPSEQLQFSEATSMGAGLAIGPVGDESAALSLQGADAITERSTEELPVKPKALVFRVGAGVVYDDNVYLNDGDKQSDLVATFNAGFTLTRSTGEKSLLTLNYDASGFLFSDNTDNSSINHALGLSANYRLPKTAFSFAASYQRLTGADREVGQFVDRDMIAVTGSATYHVSGKSDLTGSLGYSGSLYDSLNSSNDYFGRLGYNYAVTGKTRVGVAGVLGYLDADTASGQTYESVLGTVDYQATGKTRFYGDAGVNFRQYDGEDAVGDDAKFVFSAGANYQIREKTSLTVKADRGTVGSAVVDAASVERTTFQMGLNQRFNDRVSFDVSGGYEFADYQPTKTTVTTSREEEYFFARTSLNFSPTRNSTVSVFYEYRDNSSTDDGISYENNRLGMQVGISF